MACAFPHRGGREPEKAQLEGGEEEAKEAKPEEGAAATEGSEETPVPEPEELQLTLEEYEVIMAEKRAGLNAQREAAFKPDEKQFEGFKQFAKVCEGCGVVGLPLLLHAVAGMAYVSPRSGCRYKASFPLGLTGGG